MDKSKWTYKALGNVATFVGGGTPSKSNKEYYSGNIPWATVRDMTSFWLKDTEYKITKDAVLNSATNIIPKGTIVISTHVGLGKICELQQDTAINQDLKAVYLDSSIDKRYFSYWYKSNANYIISSGKGATVKGVTLNFIKDLKIPTPPIIIQQQIASELDQLNELISLKQQQLKEYDALAQSLFYEMFGDLANNEKHWNEKTLKDIAVGKLSYGSGASAIAYDGEVRYVRITDIANDGYLTNDKVSPNAIDDKYYLNDGDILFARSGATVGKTYMYRNEDGKAIYAGYLIRLIPNTEIVLPLYIFHYTKTQYYLRFIEKAQRAVAQPNINAKQYGDLMICIPPISLQHSFANKVQTIEDQKSLIKQSIAEIQTLLDSRMQEYFDNV